MISYSTIAKVFGAAYDSEVKHSKSCPTECSVEAVLALAKDMAVAIKYCDPSFDVEEWFRQTAISELSEY